MANVYFVPGFNSELNSRKKKSISGVSEHERLFLIKKYFTKRKFWYEKLIFYLLLWTIFFYVDNWPYSHNITAIFLIRKSQN